MSDRLCSGPILQSIGSAVETISHEAIVMPMAAMIIVLADASVRAAICQTLDRFHDDTGLRVDECP